MDSLIQEINAADGQRNGRESAKEMKRIEALVDQELNRLYVKTDCVDKYSDKYSVVKCENRRSQVYRCRGVGNSCSFATNKSSLIVRHIRRHLNLKPYRCLSETCNQRFYQKCELRCHLLRHFDDKPFKCHLQNCDKSYTSRKALTLHHKIHSPLGFVCHRCGQKFATNGMLKTHISQKKCVKSLTELKNKSLAQMSRIQRTIKSEDKAVDKAVDLTVDKSSTMVEMMDNDLRAEVKLKEIPKPVAKPSGSLKANRNQTKDQILSQSKAFLESFGFEEVINFMTKMSSNTDNGCDKQLSQPSNSQDISSLATDSQSDTVSQDRKPFPLFVNSVEAIASLIEICRFDGTQKVFFKCFGCKFYSESIDGVIGHTLSHIREPLFQSLSLRSKSSID